MRKYRTKNVNRKTNTLSKFTKEIIINLKEMTYH